MINSILLLLNTIALVLIVYAIRWRRSGIQSPIAENPALSSGVNMNTYSENEDWVVERGGSVAKKKAQSGEASLSDWERLVYCLWVTDYMMRNAGDFANAAVMYPNFQTDAKRFAEKLGLPATCEAFSLSQRKLQREYFKRFEAICDEIKKAEQGTGAA